MGQVALAKYNLLVPSGASHVGLYGAEACGTSTSGVHNGWDCGAADWAGPIKVGQPFNLRDVDCYDQSLDGARQQGVSVQGAFNTVDTVENAFFRT